ncbi:MAG TPA: response regulator, partial [Candidatus Omnitrophota bacterium]|nr:response regulator [Candidatus Omnitrophota bacterium]
VLIAYEGIEGFEKTIQEKPDCVILDIFMPGGEDGITYLRKIRSYSSDNLQEQARIRETPVIVLTGTGVSKQAMFEAEGISGFIQKPFNLTNMRTKVENILKLP